MKELRPYQQEAVKECWNALKFNDEPVLLMASVGAGKSLMIASVLLSMQKAGKRALCLVNNAELVRNNCATFIEQGGQSSIYCAALGSKDISGAVIFGTPKSILNGITKNEAISEIKFNLIVIDEAHAINYLNDRTTFMRILRHYKQEYSQMRLLGATGTNFRFKGTAIVGEECLFKHQVGNITTEALIKDSYLVNPTFNIDKELKLDFTGLKVKNNGTFDAKQLTEVVERSARLTELICKQVIHIMESQNRFGVFLFASTKKHAFEILSHLPAYESAIILGDTPQDERTEILNKARKGEIRYLVNIAIISVGVDVPAFDTIAYLRPTESLVLLVQTMGRVLRLSEATNKKEALVLDFAGNIERHQDWDNPLILEALKQTIDEDKEYNIQCPDCLEWNTDTARRCIGMMETKYRCEYYFEFKNCYGCGIQNDISARQCRECKAELIDPNKKLTLECTKLDTDEVQVLKAQFGVSGGLNRFKVSASYQCIDNKGKLRGINESYMPVSEKARRVFYGLFVRPHCKNSSDYYMHLQNRDKVYEMLNKAEVPTRLLIASQDDNYKIKKKFFD